MKIEWTEKVVSIDELKPAKYNPRKISKHDFESLKRSLTKFGHAYPVVCNADMTIIGGHQSVRAAKELGWKRIKASIPGSKLSRYDEKALNIALNRITGEVIPEDLSSILQELYTESEPDLKYTGMSDREINLLLKKLRRDDAEVMTVDLPDKPISKPKDIFTLGGGHRIMCGDSLSPGDVSKLMDGKKAHAIVTDPPYGVDYDSSSSGRSGAKWDKIKNDDLKGAKLQEFCGKFLINIQNNTIENYSAYIFFGDRTRHHLMNALDKLNIRYSVPLVWKKNNFTMTWDRWHGIHESIVFCGPGSSPTGSKSRWFGPNNETTVLEHNIPPAADLIHPTQKPVDLIARLISNSTKLEENVLDLFGGSGSTLIACEKTGRHGFIMELEPKYVDATIQRWENYTGEKAELVK